MEEFYDFMKKELSSAYGTSVSAGYRYITHAVYVKPVEKIESHDNALCMYDYAKEILDADDSKIDEAWYIDDVITE